MLMRETVREGKNKMMEKRERERDVDERDCERGKE